MHEGAVGGAITVAATEPPRMTPRFAAQRARALVGAFEAAYREASPDERKRWPCGSLRHKDALAY